MWLDGGLEQQPLRAMGYVCECMRVRAWQRAAEALQQSEAMAREERLAREHAVARAAEDRARLAADSDADRARLQQDIKQAEDRRAAVRGCVRRTGTRDWHKSGDVGCVHVCGLMHVHG